MEAGKKEASCTLWLKNKNKKTVSKMQKLNIKASIPSVSVLTFIYSLFEPNQLESVVEKLFRFGTTLSGNVQQK